MVEINVPRIGDIKTKTNSMILIVFMFFVVTLIIHANKAKTLCSHIAHVWLLLQVTHYLFFVS